MTLDILCNNIKKYIDERIENLNKKRRDAIEQRIEEIKYTMRQLGWKDYKLIERDIYNDKIYEIDFEIEKLTHIRKMFEEEATENDAGSQKGESLR